jgi:hypothetical protein
MWPSYERQIEEFLDISRYLVWYDEVIFAASFVARLERAGVTTKFSSKLHFLLKSAKNIGIDELAEVTQGY